MLNRILVTGIILLIMITGISCINKSNDSSMKEENVTYISDGVTLMDTLYMINEYQINDLQFSSS
jgi:hypothetical protein